MGTNAPRYPHARQIRRTRLFGVLVSLMLGLVGCEPSGDSTLSPAPPAPTAQTETQAIDNLLDLYSEALRQEDIDRLQALLQAEPATASTTRQGANSSPADLTIFRDALATTFRSQTVTGHAILPETVEMADGLTRVSFTEVESVADPLFRFHHSRVYNTTLTLQRTATAEAVQFRIAGARRDGPLVEIATQGQGQTGMRSRVIVTSPNGQFALDRTAIIDPTTSETVALKAAAMGFAGVFTASDQVSALSVQLYDNSGQLLDVAHPYLARPPGDHVVKRIPGTEGAHLFAIAVAQNGAVWAGGDRSASLYRVAPGASQAQQVQSLLSDPKGRIEDLVVDSLGRLHAVGFSPQRSGVIVKDGDTFCQTVNVLDDVYPLRDASGKPSVSTRAVATASDGAIWLLGSDAGVAQVGDGFRNGQCPASGVEVQYTQTLRREDGALPVNTVPALEVGDDGALWLGSALGLARLQNGQLTSIPFDPQVSFQGDAATLETFFQDVAQAIFEARPVASVAVGDVSFVEAFGSALVKEDLILSLAKDHQGGLWIGTLGGGIRRMEANGDTAQQTLHLTRKDGLASNIIFALAVAPDGTVWAATDDGVSRIDANGEVVVITTYTALDGLELPVRDIAVDGQGTVWVATDSGLFRLQSSQGRVVGQVHNASGQPVAEAEVIVHGASVRTVADTEGRFEVSAIAPGQYVLEVGGTTSPSGPYGATFRTITVEVGAQTLEPIVLMPPASREPIDVAQGGVITFANAPGASLDVPSQSIQFPDGEGLAIGLTLLPVDALPRPLPAGFEGVVAAQLAPPGLTFTAPARLTLPNEGEVGVGQLLVLLCLNEALGGYEQLGLGRVGTDSAVIEALSGGLTACSTVAYAATGENATKLFLVRVSGNSQRVQPGETIPAPLVVRLEDQFGNPVTGERVIAAITQGDGTIIAADPVTNVQGEAQFEVQAGTNDDDLIIEVSTTDLPNVAPAQFFAVVGELDTPGSAFDLAVADDVVFIADGCVGGLRVVDVQNPVHPVLLNTFPFVVGSLGCANSLARRGDRLYLATGAFGNLHILDISNPRDPDFAADRDADGVPDVVLGSVPFPDDLGAKQVVVQGSVVYVLAQAESNRGQAAILVFGVADEMQPELLRVIDLPTLKPANLAVLNGAMYVGVDTAGLMVFDVHIPTEPTFVLTLGDPDPSDDIGHEVITGPVAASGFAYLVETRRDQSSGAQSQHLVGFDLADPLTPLQRGAVALRGNDVFSTQQSFFRRGSGLAVVGNFVYVAGGIVGLQVIDIQNPEASRLVGLVRTPSLTRNVTAVDDLLYVTDQVFGLQVIQGPGAPQIDTDGDGVIDFFDAFPTDAEEFLDADGDRIGDDRDPDDDNDGFTDAEEVNAVPPSDPFNDVSHPVVEPPSTVTTLVVDATSVVTVRERNGTPETPYRSVTEAIQVLQSGLAPQVHTVHIRRGLYALSTTQDIFPLEFSRLSGLTIQGEGRDTTVLDAEFRADVVVVDKSADLIFENLTFLQGANGFVAGDSSGITLRHNRVSRSDAFGILLQRSLDAIIYDNIAEFTKGFHGIILADGSSGTVTQNVSRFNGHNGIDVATGSSAEVRDNLSEGNGQFGISVVHRSSATITNNISRDNTRKGIFVFQGSNARITNNVIQNHGEDGILVSRESSAVISDNIAQNNARDGILVSRESSATITDNVSQGNGRFGILVCCLSTAELINNTVTHSGRDGLAFTSSTINSVIRGGSVTANTRHGIRIGGGTAIPGPSQATIGVDSDLAIDVARNGGAGVIVFDDGSQATIDSRNFIFSDNAEGDIMGEVIDVAP